MHKFFVKTDNIINDKINITNDDVQHITKVLRLKIGDSIQICDGNENEYICDIVEINKKSVICQIKEKFKNRNESNINIVLFQGLPKAQKMELIIQKGVEIGVKEFYPIITERVVVKTDGKDISNKLERWNRIAYEAAKQSNRGIIPTVNNLISFEEALDILKRFDLIVVPYEKEKSTSFKELFNESRDYKNIAVIIGPEGGFSEEEINIFIKNGFKPITLGPRILRTETAGLVASTILLYELSDIGGMK
ncbi:16S rRNA (uracil(1498)-N(3))-methyltransferase [Caloramator proteoclasticus]|uniref:Ribosomal RNA small subunit methyltransferase E n=1 Tax=Caloramator proteoclasticus DSM 10124 TaxID=1121262 RepID=A0A1M4WXM3_9CLOT|nr:16S rRNA (uracil(1498)-N(3))-methyltransferase [Caloramator proteoclasticus]SHE86041.1 16S rRNA (uracil1498-N3)-methyltransferase [Caloramator proteoclasticus DSM 10124]